jgi:L-ascorbate metabolism protein UlaG (beta-lactamase superfamily)
MIITYYGASCFKIQAGETVAVFDLPSKDSKIKSPRFQTNLILVSDNNENNNGIDAPGKQEGIDPFVVDGPGEYELGEIYVSGVKSEVSEKYGINTIYTMVFDDIKLCHFGDFNKNKLDDEIKEAIGDVDILFIPIGGEDVLDVAWATKITMQIEPKIVIPMNYKDANSIKKFVNEFGGEVKSLDKLTIKKKDIVEGKTQAVVLKQGRTSD